MQKLPLIARLLLGFVFFASGLVGLFDLAPPPEDLPESMKTFMAGMLATKYFFPLLKLTETVCGGLLLSGFFVPLALVVLAPITLNILMLHLFIAPSGLPIALGICVLHLYLSFFAPPYRDTLLALFKPSSTRRST